MDTASSPSAATMAHSQMRHETRGSEPEIMTLSPLLKRLIMDLNCTSSVHEWQTTVCSNGCCRWVAGTNYLLVDPEQRQAGSGSRQRREHGGRR